MEVATSTVAEVPATSTEAAPNAPEASTASASAQASPEPQNQPQAATAEPQAYQPSYKFKVLDKEQEFDEWVRPVVKSKEHEQKLRELYEKAHGLDHVKTARDQVKQQFEGYKTQWEPIKTQVFEAAKYRNVAMQALEQGDVKAAVFHYENAFKHLGISDKELQQYVFQKLQFEDLPADQKAEYNRRRELEQNQLAAQDKLSSLEQQNQNLLRQQKSQELQQALSKPEVAQLIQSFDQENGPEAFKKEVIRRGFLLEQLDGRQTTADELVSEMMKLFRISAPQAPTQMPQATASAPAELPVIPAVKGGSTSPAAKSFKTVEDVEAYRKQKYGY